MIAENITDMSEIAYAIWYRTEIDMPGGGGFSVKVG
jgi:hypothetical protein